MAEHGELPWYSDLRSYYEYEDNLPPPPDLDVSAYYGTMADHTPPELAASYDLIDDFPVTELVAFDPQIPGLW